MNQLQFSAQEKHFLFINIFSIRKSTNDTDILHIHWFSLKQDLVIEAYDSEGDESEGEESGNKTEESERQQTEVTRRGTNNHLLVTNSKRSVKLSSWLKDYSLL